MTHHLKQFEKVHRKNSYLQNESTQESIKNRRFQNKKSETMKTKLKVGRKTKQDLTTPQFHFDYKIWLFSIQIIMILSLQES